MWVNIFLFYGAFGRKFTIGKPKKDLFGFGAGKHKLSTGKGKEKRPPGRSGRKKISVLQSNTRKNSLLGVPAAKHGRSTNKYKENRPPGQIIRLKTPQGGRGAATYYEL